MKEICLPMASAAVYPKILSPPLFQLATIPVSDVLMIASSQDSTIAARWPVCSSFSWSIVYSTGEVVDLACGSLFPISVFNFTSFGKVHL